MATSSTSDKPHDWIYVASAFMVHFTISLSMKSWGVMFLVLLEKFNKSATTTSWPLGIAAMVMGLAGWSLWGRGEEGERGGGGGGHDGDMVSGGWCNVGRDIVNFFSDISLRK